MKFPCGGLFVVGLLYLWGYSSFVHAMPSLDTPIQVSNQSPMVRIYGLPAAESAELLKADQQLLSISLDIANNFARGFEGAERIWLDGESAITTARWRFGSESWQWGFDLPYIYQSGGSMDSFIFQWHQTLGLSQADRDKVEKNEIDYVFNDAEGKRLLNVRSTNHGIGDIRTNVAYPLLQTVERALAVRGELKLPSADSDYLHGSGGTDISIGIMGLDRLWMHRWNTTVHGTFGLLWTDKGDVLSQQREQLVAYASAGFTYNHSDSVAFKLQLDGHGPFYDNDFDELAESMQLSLGGSLRMDKNWLLDMVIIEDISVDSASDVVFHFNLKRGLGF